MKEAIAASLPTFHEMSAGGYNGRLARAFIGRHRTATILELMTKMRRLGERPTTVLSYNYLLSALLSTGARRDAYLLLREMEERGMSPDVFTFEQLLYDLAKDEGLAVTVEELFQLMSIKYGLKPSASCWSSRIRVWMARFNELRVLNLFEEMRTTDPRVATDVTLYVAVARSAVLCALWDVASHVLSCITPTATSNHHSKEIFVEYQKSDVQPTNPPIIFTNQDYYELLTIRYRLHDPQQVPILRFVLQQLDSSQMLLDEGVYVRILYFAARIGNAVGDLAYFALQRLVRLYGRGISDNSSVVLPRHYLEAYVHCIDTASNADMPFTPNRDPLPSEVACDIRRLLSQ